MTAYGQARQWLEEIRSHVMELNERERDLQDLRLQSQPKGQRYGSIGHASGPKDASAPILRAIQADVDLDVLRAKVNAEVSYALQVLYGCDGRGGLAQIKGSSVADCICGYYLQGLTWPEVAAQLGWPDTLKSKDGPQLCKRRAYRGIEQIELLGTEAIRWW